jgi:3-oxoacyl-[acyl-carrier protein] reductase
MDLKLKGQLFIVTGASSGLGKAVLERLVREGASVIANARRAEILQDLAGDYPGQIIQVPGNLTHDKTIESIISSIAGFQIHGIFLNGGGPPAKSIRETSLKDWDDAYGLLIRWKVMLIKQLIPVFEKHQYGRILFSESVTIKQPVENLVLSNSLRMAIVGFAKTLSMEYASKGITANTIAPGYHATAAVERLFNKKSEQEGITSEKARERMIEEIPAGKMGDPSDFASLAAWLLSPLAGFVTGQIFTLEGGTVRASI